MDLSKLGEAINEAHRVGGTALVEAAAKLVGPTEIFPSEAASLVAIINAVREILANDRDDRRPL